MLQLRHTIVDDGRPQYEIAGAAGIEESKLSKAIHGRLLLSAEEKANLAGVLATSAAELFGGKA